MRRRALLWRYSYLEQVCPALPLQHAPTAPAPMRIVSTPNPDLTPVCMHLAVAAMLCACPLHGSGSDTSSQMGCVPAGLLLSQVRHHIADELVHAHVPQVGLMVCLHIEWRGA